MKTKQEKREQAKKRQEFYNKLSFEEKLAKMEKASGECKKQQTRFKKLKSITK